MYNLKEYKESVKKFIEDTKEWGALDEYKHYVAINGEWVESCDNAEGGIDVSWAFNKEYNDYLCELNFMRFIKMLVDNDINFNIEVVE